MHDFQTIIDFWFLVTDPQSWWKKDTAFDQLIRQCFSVIHQSAIFCELAEWRTESLGKLSEIIVLNQFSRNIYRDDPRAFADNALALALAQEAINNGIDKTLLPDKKLSLYMPFMHSESKIIHEIALTLFRLPGLLSNYKFEFKHKAIFDCYRRYPHRNKILRRQSTDEEISFLEQPDSSF